MNSLPYQKSETNGIKRARARGLFLLHASRTQISSVLKKEYGGLAHPGIYILLKTSSKKAYVGESADTQDRINQWVKNAPKEFKDWDNVIIINDMRQINYSDFANSDVRKKIEKRFVQILKENEYGVVNKQETQPKLSDEQPRETDHIFSEIEFLVTEYRLIIERKKKRLIRKKSELNA